MNQIKSDSDEKYSELGMQRRTKLLKGLLIILCLITISVIAALNLKSTQMPSIHEKRNFMPKGDLRSSQPIFKIFHLDLKGGPPRMKYILDILPLAKMAGANGVLIEYEDMFPWHGSLRNISAKNAFTVREVESLLKEAQNLKLEVIPLVQTFGHLEMVLKLQEFRHLRELDSFPQEICPSKKEAIHLIREMITQIMEIHNSPKFLHIGCDEVYHIGACSACSTRNARVIFTEHVKAVSEFVRSISKDTRVIIWDDMLRRWPPVEIENSGLGKAVDLMVWVYIDDIPRLVPNYLWFVYKKAFPRIWAASAYKGASGEKEVIPDLSRHVENHLAWLRMMRPNPEESHVMNENDFTGIALTGWSRYDHFAVLAELLPLAIPSLILNLALVDSYVSPNYESQAFKIMENTLHCPSQLSFDSIEEVKQQKYHWFFGACEFPGSSLYPLIAEYFKLQARYNYVLKEKNSNGWVSEYNFRNNFSSPWRLLSMFPEEGFAAQNLKKAVLLYKSDISQCLNEYFDEHTVREWIEQKVSPMEQCLNEIERTFRVIMEMKSWRRRPL